MGKFRSSGSSACDTGSVLLARDSHWGLHVAPHLAVKFGSASKEVSQPPCTKPCLPRTAPCVRGPDAVPRLGLLVDAAVAGPPRRCVALSRTAHALAYLTHSHNLVGAGAWASILLFSAASDGDAAKLKTLLDKDKYDVDWRGEYGMSPVHIATLNNHPDCVRLLIKAGAKVNQYDNDGWTPLMAAAAFAEHKLVKMLLDAGANPTRRAQKGHHEGMNAKDLVKQIVEQKPTSAKKCIALLEGRLRASSPTSQWPVSHSRLPHALADGVKAWWAKKEAKKVRRESDRQEGSGDDEGDAANDGSEDKSEL